MKAERIDIDAIRRESSVADLAAAAGVKLIRAGAEFKACCPFHGDRSPSFTIFDRGRRWHCFGCGKGGDNIDFVRELHGVDFRSAAALLTAGDLPKVDLAPAIGTDEPCKDARIAEARAIWRAAVPAPGTLAESYLRTRGIEIAIPETIRFSRLRYGRKGPEYPCLIAVVAGANNQLSGIQRTYLNSSGTGKAAVPKAKLSLGKISGGAIRLAPAAAELVVCEGLEDGLTLLQNTGQAAWVAAGAGNMARMEFPDLVRRVQVGGDADEAGRTNAANAVEAFEGRGLLAQAFFPVGAKDFNAELMGGSRT